MRLSILAILLAAAAALVSTGLAAFGGASIDPAQSQIHALFKMLPREGAYAAPIVAGVVIALAFGLLRIVGQVVTIAGTAACVVLVLAFAFRPEFSEWVAIGWQALAALQVR